MSFPLPGGFPGVPQQQTGVAAQPEINYGSQQVPPAPQPPQQPAQQQAQPAPGFGQPMPGFTAPQQQFQQPQPPQAPPQQINLGARITAAPGVPQELIGRTWGEALQYYGVLRDQFIQNQQRQQIQPQAQPQQPLRQPAPQPPQQPQGQQPPVSSFWTDPEGTLERIVEKRMLQAQLPATVQGIRQQLAALPHYQQLEPLVVQQMAQLAPELQANPQVWRQAYNMVVGDLVTQGRLPAVQQQPQQPGGFQQMPLPPQQPTGQQMQAGQPWIPAFTEAPNGTAGIRGYVALTPEEDTARQKFGMTMEQWNAWKGGQAQ